MLAQRENEMSAARERSEDYLRRELAVARDTARAQLDLTLCMDALCNWRGPRGERYQVEYVAAKPQR